MITYKKHIQTFKSMLHILKTEKDINSIRNHIIIFMKYLEKHHLLIKDYAAYHKLFLCCEVKACSIKDQSIEAKLAFLTLIHRMDFIDSNSDVFIMYYKNHMLQEIIESAIDSLELLIGGMDNV